MCGTEFTPVLDDNEERCLECDRDALREELERVKATLTHIYELAMTEDGLADFDADSIRDAWMGYVSREEYDEKQAELERIKADMKPLVEALSCVIAHTDPDNPNSYRADDREGCLDTVYAISDKAWKYAKAKGWL
jgi:hypothetical protein